MTITFIVWVRRRVGGSPESYHRRDSIAEASTRRAVEGTRAAAEAAKKAIQSNEETELLAVGQRVGDRLNTATLRHTEMIQR